MIALELKLLYLFHAGLAFLAEKYLGMKLKKNGSIHSRWEKKELGETLLKYAAEDAYASIEVFKALVDLLKPKGLSIPMGPIRWEEFFDANWVGVQYKFNRGTSQANQDSKTHQSIKVSVNKRSHNNDPRQEGISTNRCISRCIITQYLFNLICYDIKESHLKGLDSILRKFVLLLSILPPNTRKSQMNSKGR